MRTCGRSRTLKESRSQGALNGFCLPSDGSTWTIALESFPIRRRGQSRHSRPTPWYGRPRPEVLLDRDSRHWDRLSSLLCPETGSHRLPPPRTSRASHSPDLAFQRAYSASVVEGEVITPALSWRKLPMDDSPFGFAEPASTPIGLTHSRKETGLHYASAWGRRSDGCVRRRGTRKSPSPVTSRCIGRSWAQSSGGSRTSASIALSVLRKVSDSPSQDF